MTGTWLAHLTHGIVRMEACRAQTVQNRPVFVPHRAILHAHVQRELADVAERARVHQVLEHLPLVVGADLHTEHGHSRMDVCAEAHSRRGGGTMMVLCQVVVTRLP